MPPRSISESVFLILTALVDEPRHGWGIVAEVLALSRGRVDLPVGTLYGALDRLSGEGLVAREREEIWQGRPRRYYRLTDDGRRVVHEEADRQAANARAARVRLARTLRPGPLGSPS